MKKKKGFKKAQSMPSFMISQRCKLEPPKKKEEFICFCRQNKNQDIIQSAPWTQAARMCSPDICKEPSNGAYTAGGGTLVHQRRPTILLARKQRIKSTEKATPTKPVPQAIEKQLVHYESFIARV
jgi:hypothetical protein